MIFHRARIKNKYENTVQIQGNMLDHVNATTFLGIIIDNKLNWSDHINYIENINYVHYINYPFIHNKNKTHQRFYIS